jgi:hypothetical protein
LKAPKWFVTELHEFDPDLRIRWSGHMEMWHLERQVRRGLHPGTIRTDGYHDDYVRARDGFILVACVPPRMLCREIFEKLRTSDLWSNGGWQKIIRDIEEGEQAVEDKKWTDFQDKIKHLSAEVYNFISYRSGSRIFPGEAVKW